ncbi:MAG: DEAD/DEAH box helicase [Synergistaceae bacterium]|nr:DEAD/DEAH box helicase [Synergistaceae bacterium]
MSALDDILQKISDTSDDTQKGRLFEALCWYFLKHDKVYGPSFSDIWLWRDWPDNEGMPDTGIDIVAKFRDKDTLCAVQCKFRQDDSTITKDEINSFLALSSKEIYSARILFTITGNFSSNANDALLGQHPPVKVLTRYDLEQSSIDWDKFSFDDLNHAEYITKTLRPHQVKAVNDVLNGFVHHDKGKLIMACGTGKTFTSLKIAESYSGRGGLILVLAPSISLLNQSLLAWNYDHDEKLPLISFAVCSDATVGQKDYPDEDMKTSDLAISPTTNSQELFSAWRNSHGKSYSLTVIFSTYQSLQVVHDAQTLGLPRFDLIICDEAHRTAGLAQNENETSSFKLIHNDDFISSRKRLYMTATPKIFGENAKAKAKEKYLPIYSMDDENIFGPELSCFLFSDAIDKNLLSDYKVIIFMYDYDADSQAEIKIDDELSISLSDGAKIIGIRKALAKELSPADNEALTLDPEPMKSAVVFTSTIANSKVFTKAFGKVTELAAAEFQQELHCMNKHIDGSDPVSVRENSLSWLNRTEENSCHILSNARCLSEGVDVPALDAVIFLNPKRSEIDIVQSVGRVMRKADAKKFGYIIIPIAVRSDIKPEDALDKNKEYDAIWKVLKALRSHDNKFQAVINDLNFSGRSRKLILVPPRINTEIYSRQIEIDYLQEWEKTLTAKIVDKCGDREYWDKWTHDLIDIAAEIEAKIREALTHRKAEHEFAKFLDDLKAAINPQISRDTAIDMLTQHIITKPVFDAFFSKFSQLNPVSLAMQKIINSLAEYKIDDRLKELQNFYSHVYQSAQQAATSEAKQKFIKHLYEDFFRHALPKASQKLGVVYTPDEIVDFILRSSDWALREILNFSDGLSSPDVRILDPFSGTGTFTARLIHSGLLNPEIFGYHYVNKIFANEILPLAYYISAVNIEDAFHEVNGGSRIPFHGLSLTDTFTLSGEPERTIPIFMLENGLNTYVQSKLDINVIIGNPPYSVGQKSANDNNQNTKYEALNAQIKETYAKKSSAVNKNSLYDSYILAFRWASDRLGDKKGVICFVTNGAFIDSNSADGMRKSLAEEFSAIYIFNLRGNQRTGDWRKEGEKIFGEGSQCSVAITLLVKKGNDKDKAGPCEIYYYESGDYMRRSEKLSELVSFGSFGGMMNAGIMRRIVPNDKGDWINQRQEVFESFMRLGNKKEREEFAIFGTRYSIGLTTGRDAWCYNFSRESLCENMRAMIEVYNSERERWGNYHGEAEIRDFVNSDERKISWSRGLFKRAANNEPITFRDEAVRVSLYRPFVKEYCCFDERVNEYVYSMPEIFPEHDTKNLLICLSGIGANKNFSVLMTDYMPCCDEIDKGQCFPLYWYERVEGSFLGSGRNDGISDDALSKFRVHYDDMSIEKEDIFYYIYGVLSSPEYALRFGDDTKKMLARVPFASSFREFARIGRELGKLHVNYEGVDEWPIELEGNADDLRVTKMRIVERNGEKVIRYNDGLTIAGIPAEAWDYVVNGRSALGWIVERYRDDVDRASGLRNDCNAWGRETGNERYILELIGRVTRVSVESVRILRSVPELGV